MGQPRKTISRPTETTATKRVEKFPSNEREFKGWVNIHLPDDAKARFFSWAEANKLDDLMLKVVADNYRISLYWDEYNECHAASLTCWNKHTDQYGYSLSMRGSDPLTALWRVLYTHYDFCKENWGAWMTRPTKSDW